MAHIETHEKPVSMPITNEMMACKIHGIKRTFETGITGKQKIIDGVKQFRNRTDKDGNVVLKDGAAVKEAVPEFETIGIKVTIDFEGATLQQIFMWLTNKSSSLIVTIQNQNRPLGEAAVRALDGTTILYTDLLVDRVGGGRSPEAVMMGAIDKIKDPVEQEKKKMQLIEMLQNSMK